MGGGRLCAHDWPCRFWRSGRPWSARPSDRPDLGDSGQKGGVSGHFRSVVCPGGPSTPPQAVVGPGGRRGHPRCVSAAVARRAAGPPRGHRRHQLHRRVHRPREGPPTLGPKLSSKQTNERTFRRCLFALPLARCIFGETMASLGVVAPGRGAGHFCWVSFLQCLKIVVTRVSSFLHFPVTGWLFAQNRWFSRMRSMASSSSASPRWTSTSRRPRAWKKPFRSACRRPGLV